MRTLLHSSHRARPGLAIMLLRLDALVVPKLVDLGNEFPWRTRGRVDPVVVVVEDEWDAKFATEWEKVVYVVAEL